MVLRAKLGKARASPCGHAWQSDDQCHSTVGLCDDNAVVCTSGSKRAAPLPNRLPLVGALGHNIGWVILAAWAIAVAGCHKKTPVTAAIPANEQVEPETQTSPGQPVQVQSGGVSGTSQPLEGEVHPLMTYQLHIFVQQKGRLPTDFAELSRTRLDAVPRTPPGMTWAIDRVTQEVKLVKK